MDLVENDVDILHEEIKDLVCHLVGNDVDTLHEERIYLVGFSFIRVIDDLRPIPCQKGSGVDTFSASSIFHYLFFCADLTLLIETFHFFS